MREIDSNLTTTPSEHLRVLIAHGDIGRLTSVASVVTGLGHVVIAQAVDLRSVGKLTASERPDVAMIVVGENSANTLKLIDKVVRESVCPVIALLEVEDPAFRQTGGKERRLRLHLQSRLRRPAGLD